MNRLEAKELGMALLAWGIIASILLGGCASTNQPNVGSGEVNDKTLNGNVVDFFTLIRVQNNYGTNIRVDDSDNAKVSQ